MASMKILSEPEYGALEVDHRAQWAEVLPNNSPQVVANPNEKVYAGDSMLERPEELNAAGAVGAERRTCGLRRRTFWIVVAVAAVIIIAAAVGGGVGGALAISGDTTAVPSTTAISNTNATTRPATRRGVSSDSKIAALNWTSTDGAKHYRVYFQDERNNIQESAWDSGSRSWRVTPVTNNSYDVKVGTPLAATAGRDEEDAPFGRNLYYLTSEKMVHELYSTSSEPKIWRYGGLTYTKWTAGADSHLAGYRVLPGQHIPGQNTSVGGSGVMWQAGNSNLTLASFDGLGGWTAREVPGYPYAGAEFALKLANNEWLSWYYLSYNDSSSSPLVLHEASLNTSGQSSDWPLVTYAPPDNDAIAMWQADGPLTLSTSGTSADVQIVHCSANCHGLNVTARVDGAWVGDRQFGFGGGTAKNYTAIAGNNDGRMYALFSDDDGLGIEEWAIANSGVSFNFVGLVATSNT